MSIFIPPTDDFVQQAIMPDEFSSTEMRMAYRLYRHYAPTARGRNVYKLTNGTYTENEPADMTTVAVTYYGGHATEVTATEAASLTAAGYGAYIS